MIFENTSVYNIENAMRGMRNPMNSWKKNDSYGNEVGPNDLELLKKLVKAGPEHRKCLRQIFISVDITAPLYWWKEFDTYKIGTTANSTSTMHKLATAPITEECFELGDYNERLTLIDDQHLGVRISQWIDDLEQLRQKYLITKDKKYWKELVRWLPEGWLQTRTVTMNYENVLNMILQRKGHKLVEWSEDFISWATNLPLMEVILKEVEK